MADIIIAVLALVGSLGGTYFANRRQTALLDYRMGLLEKKMDKHNNVMERTFQLEQDTAVIKEQIKVANHRIADLEDLAK